MHFYQNILHSNIKCCISLESKGILISKNKQTISIIKLKSFFINNYNINIAQNNYKQ